MNKYGLKFTVKSNECEIKDGGEHSYRQVIDWILENDYSFIDKTKKLEFCLLIEKMVKYDEKKVKIGVTIFTISSQREGSSYLGHFTNEGVEFLINNYFSEFDYQFYFVFENRDGSKYKTEQYISQPNSLLKLSQNDIINIKTLLI